MKSRCTDFHEGVPRCAAKRGQNETVFVCRSRIKKIKIF